MLTAEEKLPFLPLSHAYHALHQSMLEIAECREQGKRRNVVAVGRYMMEKNLRNPTVSVFFNVPDYCLRD